MKRSILSTLAFVAALFFGFAAFAQPGMVPPELTDPNVRMGKLDNGLTYYIRHNEYPKGQADFHIAQKVGAVQEEEHQNGLAHFLEHMCFNGTKNFPDKALLTWLESIGVKFGYNLNAHTGTDETVYDITNVPVARESVVDSCLLILHDWADALTLADEEIEKERGVIHEEWRMGNGAIARLLRKHAPELYPNTKYATHDVIGSMDVVDNFAPQVLKDYYEKWYRPDLQGIIVVGDIDVDLVESKVKALFSPIKMPENPAEFKYEQLADSETPVIISDSDAEMPINVVLIAQKSDFIPREYRNTDASLITDFMNYVVKKMIDQRLTDIAMSPDAPFAGCDVSYGQFLYASTKAALMFQAIVNDKGTEAATETVLTEMRRVKEFGFTVSEYQRAVDEYMSVLEKAYNNRNTDKNNVYAQTYISHFIKNDPICDIAYQYEKMKQITPMLPVDAINMYAKALFGENTQQPSADQSLGKNLVIFSLAPAKEGVKVSTVDEMKAVLDKVNGAKVEAYVDNTVNEPLLATLPTAGKVVKSTENKALGYTELTLSNGARVILKPTAFKDNEIIFRATSKGGASLYSAEDYPNVTMAGSMIPATGLSKFAITDLQKLLSGKQVQVAPSVGGYDEGLSGRSTVKDLETMMQLIYLNFTQPREDEVAFNSIKKLYISQLENYGKNPQYVFQDSLVRNLSGHHPKAMIQTKEMIEKTDYKRMLEIYKERFADAGDFTFVFVGNFDLAKMQALVEQYIGSLPTKGVKETRVDDGNDIVKGEVKHKIVFPNESKQAMLALIWSADIPYTLENKIKASVTGQLMANNLLNSVREDEGAAYSPYSTGSANREIKDQVLVQTVFGVNPDKTESSSKLAIASLTSLAEDIPNAELNKIKEFMLKSADENVRENNYWLRTILDYAIEGVDGYTGYKDVVNALTPAAIQDFVKEILKQGNRFEQVMLPE